MSDEERQKSAIERHIDDQHYRLEHMQPGTCDPCARNWHYLPPATRRAYALRRFHFGRGAPREDGETC